MHDEVVLRRAVVNASLFVYLFKVFILWMYNKALKAGFHVSEKSHTVGYFTFCQPSQIFPIYRIVVGSLSRLLATSSGDAMFMCDRVLVMSEVHSRTSPTIQN